MSATLRLYEDTLSADGPFDHALAAMPRMVFVVHGSATIDGKTFADGEAWFGEGPLSVVPGKAGVACWRFELASSASGGASRGNGVVSHEKLAVALETL